MALARHTGWGLGELMGLEVEEAHAWFIELRDQLRAEQPRPA